MVEQNTLLHTKTLLVVSTGDLEDISLEFVTKGVSGNFLRDTFIIEDAPVGLEWNKSASVQLLFVVNFNDLLTAVLRIRDVELFGCEQLSSKGEKVTFIVE